MKSEVFGGNLVKTIDLISTGKKVLASGPYEYFLYETAENETLNLNDLGSFTVYIFEKSEMTKIRVVGFEESAQQGDCLQCENCDLQIQIEGGGVKLLIAGTASSHPTAKGLSLTKKDDIYKVEKPWGYELWLNGQHPLYALKSIFIKAGTKTSLQYHNFKQETNVLFKGTAKLHYKQTDVANDFVRQSDLATTLLEPVSSVDIVPRTLHRIEALSDILLLEASTPHLDDVIRIQDDSRRPSGRLEAEHKQL